MSLSIWLRARARSMKQEVLALWLAVRDPRTPLVAKLVAGVVVAYALSPIDLIPDFIPVLGYLDDLVLVPLGIALALRLIPTPVLADARARASELHALPKNYFVATLFVLIWIALATGGAWLGWRWWHG
ncbi:MAG: DUF1232 domain-containing protein [Proteobacteria bacterium]|nr:DUF1232 domain-containing protein [Burkholderiales bacterium]